MPGQYQTYKKSNFGGAFFFLPEEKRAALSIIYDFCRTADDIADEGFADAKERLAALRDEVKNVFNRNPKTPLGNALIPVLEKYPIPEQYFADLLDGVERDLQTPVCFDTFEDLKWYMRRVAGVVGKMCVEIFGYTNPQAKEYADTLGYAVQLTNILRDIEQDAKINRIYIPKEDLETFGLTEEDLLAPKLSAKLKEVLLFELARAQNYYKEAKALLPKEDFKNLLAARAMGNIYYALFKKLQKTPCRFDAKKIKLNKLEKFFILFKTFLERP
jgi:phytoene synthase